MFCSEQCVLARERGERKGEVTISPLTSHNIPNHRKKLLAGRVAQWCPGGQVHGVPHKILSELSALFGSFQLHLSGLGKHAWIDEVKLEH